MRLSPRYWLREERTRGNALVAAVLVVSIISMFGAIMTGRMIVDANVSAQKLVATRAFYLADSGVQWARRYLANGNSAATTLGPLSIGGGTVTVVLTQTTIRYTYDLTSTDVYKIVSTATVGNTTRVVEELRRRGGGGSDKDFFMWRESVADEF